MKMTDLLTDSYIDLLIMGEPGAGKSVLACSFPTPILYLDFDGKADSAARFYNADKARLDGIDVRTLKKTMTNDPVAELNQIIDKELIPQERSGKMQYATVILDSITTFSASALYHIVKTNPGIKRVTTPQGAQPGLQDYGILKREFQRLIPGLLGLPCNVVMIAHVAATKDDLTGEISRKPVMDGGFSDILAAYFKEVWMLSADKGKRIAQTQSDYKYKCRSQIPGLPEKFDVTDGYPALIPYLK